MRKLIILTLTAASVVAGPFAAVASANPVLEASCNLQEKLGVSNVQDCDFS